MSLEQPNKRFHLLWLDDSKVYLKPLLMTLVSKTFFAPIERYRLIRQTQDLFLLYPKDHSTNLASFVQKSVKNQGISSLWKSNLTSIYMMIPQFLGQYLFYENIKQGVLEDNPQSLLLQTVSASLCSFSCLIFTYPFDTVRVRQATELGTKNEQIYKKFTKTFSQIRSKEGFIKGIYSGLSVALIHSSLMALFSIILHDNLPKLKFDNQTLNSYTEGKELQLAYFLSFQILYPLDSIRYTHIEIINQRHRLQIKSVLFNQEASKSKNYFVKISQQFSNPNIKWIYGGWGAHCVRTFSQVVLLHHLSELNLTEQNKLE